MRGIHRLPPVTREMCPFDDVIMAKSMQHYDDVIMSAIASQITSLIIVYSIVYPGADQSKHQSSASLAFVWGIHRGFPVTRKMFPFDDVIMDAYVWTRGLRDVRSTQQSLWNYAFTVFMTILLITRCNIARKHAFIKAQIDALHSRFSLSEYIIHCRIWYGVFRVVFHPGTEELLFPSWHITQ